MAKDISHFVCHGARPDPGIFVGKRTDRMRQNDKGHIGQPQRAAFSLGESRELIRTQRGRGNTPPLQFYPVVDTPRGTRPSVPHPVNDHSATGGKFAENTIGAGMGYGRLSKAQDFGKAEALRQGLADLIEDEHHVGLAVVQNAKD